MTEQSYTSLDQKYLWHPFSQTKDLDQQANIIIKKAKHISLYSENGQRYYDTISSWWCNILGHSHPQVVKSINDQIKSLDHVIFAGFSHPKAIELAKYLVQNTPEGLDKVFYSDNGSTAIEVAIKQSLQYWSLTGEKTKKTVACFNGGYHGDTIGTMSVSGTDHFHSPFKHLCFKSEKLPNPSPLYDKNQEEICLDACKKLFKENHTKLAAVIVEPLMMGAGGMLPNSGSFIKELDKLCRHYQIHLILDEVAVGFGRTGSLFACEKIGICPDFLCLSKGISNGNLPIAATLTSNKIFNAFTGPYETHTFFHGHTFTGNPIASAAACATFEVLLNPNTLKKANNRIIELKHYWEDLANTQEIYAPRQCGLIAAFDLVDSKTKTIKRLGKHIYQLGLKHQLILRPLGNTIYLYLPLTIQKDELLIIILQLKKVLNEWKTLSI